MSSNGQPVPPIDWKRLAIQWGGWLVAVIVSAALAYFGLVVPVPPPPIVIDEVPAQGWVQDPQAVAQVVGEMQFRNFAETPAALAKADLPDHAYLWDAYRKIFREKPPSKNQGQVGSCVSFGTNTAIRRTMAVEIAFLGKKNEFKDIVEEATYGGSRVEVGGGRLRGDGSVGAWAAKFVQKWGVLARGKYGTLDLTAYSESTCRQFGSKGVPDELEPILREHPVQETTLVRSWTEAKQALANGYGIAICSDQGFSMQRDSRGICLPQGSWAHCMCLDGYHLENNEEYGHIENSWGPAAHRGPLGWGDPPPSGFWADSATIERMLRQGDSWAFSAVKGFPARVDKLDWYVYVPRPQRRGWIDEPLYALAP